MFCGGSIMNIYDKVHELANELKECEEVKNL